MMKYKLEKQYEQEITLVQDEHLKIIYITKMLTKTFAQNCNKIQYIEMRTKIVAKNNNKILEYKAIQQMRIVHIKRKYE